MKYFFSDPMTISKFQSDPLGKYLDSYAAHLHERGYSWNTGRCKIRLIARFSKWLEDHGVAAKDLTMLQIQEYQNSNNREGRSPQDDRVAIRQFMEFLHTKEILKGSFIAEIRLTASQHLAEVYAQYLRTERALSPGTIAQYKSRIEQFLNHSFGEGSIDLSTLRPAAIATFVTMSAVKLSRKGANLVCSALRSFFRYARYQGYIDADLAASVPSVANWASGSIPRALPREQVLKVLACCDQHTTVGLRNYAILLLLARLGLRAGEIASTQLDDIDWKAGCISVHGKGSNLAQLPMPPDVGEAIALYLRGGRPQSLCRAVFLTAQAPIAGFARPSAICIIVRNALSHAGINTKRNGAHQFRHALAIELLRTGASLPEIAEVLRHGTLECTAMYAKVDLASLRSMGLPWPGGVK